MGNMQRTEREVGGQNSIAQTDNYVIHRWSILLNWKPFNPKQYELCRLYSFVRFGEVSYRLHLIHGKGFSLAELVTDLHKGGFSSAGLDIHLQKVSY